MTAWLWKIFIKWTYKSLGFSIFVFVYCMHKTMTVNLIVLMKWESSLIVRTSFKATKMFFSSFWDIFLQTFQWLSWSSMITEKKDHFENEYNVSTEFPAGEIGYEFAYKFLKTLWTIEYYNWIIAEKINLQVHSWNN